MDLDEMMSKVYAPVNVTKERRVAVALAYYHETRIQYGNGSPEEKQVYAVMVKIFPEMKGLRETINDLQSALGQERILSDESIKELGIDKV